MGNLYKGPDVSLPPQAFQLKRVSFVGGYAVQPFWGDGHSSGLFSFDYLRRVAGGPTEQGAEGKRAPQESLLPPKSGVPQPNRAPHFCRRTGWGRKTARRPRGKKTRYTPCR